MNRNTRMIRYRRMSVISLAAGILTYSYIYLIPKLILHIVTYLRNFISNEALIASIVSILVALLLGLPFSAVTCGSIDLKRIKSGIYAARGKGMDIAGIVLGSLFILAIALFLAGEMVFPHQTLRKPAG